MSNFDVLCPHCERTFILSMMGPNSKEFILCPLCRSLIKLDLADPGEKIVPIATPDFVS